MIKKYLFLLLAVSVYACSNADKAKTPVTDIEVANAFVRNLLDDDFKAASQYLLKDTVNLQLFESFQKQYNRQGKAILDKYRQASIVVNETSYITDSVFIFNYCNSYKPADTTVLKLIRPADKWLVDLKYTFSGN
jgi:hypothetical protein